MVLLIGVCSEGSVWLVREVRRVLRLLGVGSKTKNWVDCNTCGSWASAPSYQSLSQLGMVGCVSSGCVQVRYEWCMHVSVHKYLGYALSVST